MFLVVPYESVVPNEAIGTAMLELATRVGEFLSRRLGLSLNPLKTYWTVAEDEDGVSEAMSGASL